MKIAIPVEQNREGSKVSDTFGRTAFYQIYDTEKKESAFIENTAASASGGAGIKAAQIVVDSGAQILLSPRCGENAAKILLEAGIKLYKTFEGGAQENIDAYLEGRLEILDEIHAGHHGGGN